MMLARISIALALVMLFCFFAVGSDTVSYAYPGPDPKPICPPVGTGPYPGPVNYIQGFCYYTDGIYSAQTGNAGNGTTGSNQTSAGNSAANNSGSTAPKEVPEADTQILFGGGIVGLGAWLRLRWASKRRK